jgi:hypothetical protein
MVGGRGGGKIRKGMGHGARASVTGHGGLQAKYPKRIFFWLPTKASERA